MSAWDAELDRQTSVMSALGYPTLARQDEAAFLADVQACRPAVDGLAHLAVTTTDADQAAEDVEGAAEDPARTGRVRFVLVTTRVPVPAALALTRLDGGHHPGVLDRNHGQAGLAPYRPIEQVTPPAPVYVLHGGAERLIRAAVPDAGSR